MCGIAGHAAMDGRGEPAPEPVAAMLERLRHRGPDDEGLYRGAGVVLGHRRLSVIDPEGGHQPLRGARAGTVIVTNGEVYNYRALARELEDLGHGFETASDAEVAAHAYDEWGLEFLERLDGMFALALWDGSRRRLVLARDRLGEKPLYWAIAEGRLVFASELDALLEHGAVPFELDPQALSEYLALEYVPAPRSIVTGVNKLEPGTALVLEEGRISLHRYWRLEVGDRSDLDYVEAVECLRELLVDSVRSRLVSDVPLGVFLSGGIDSSAVAALAVEAGETRTFCIGFREASFDESGHARQVAAHIGSDHHERILEAAEVPALVPEVIGGLDEPLGDASILPTALLARFARQRVTVALGGDGGDELFAGYPMHQARRVAGPVRALPRWLHRLGLGLARALPLRHDNFTLRFKAETFLRGAGLPPPLDHATWMASFPPESQASVLRPEVREAGGNGAAAFDAVIRAWAESAGAPPLARSCHLDARTYLPNDILTKVDRAAMAVGLEVRAPLLSPALVEFAFALPDAFRMRRLTGKRIFRDAVRPWLPAEIVSRPKKGFGMPVGAWLRGPLRELVHDYLGADALAAGGVFDGAGVGRLLDEHQRGARDHRKPLWTLLVFEIWRRGLSGNRAAEFSRRR